MSAQNHSGSSGEGTGGEKLPVLQPESKEQMAVPEVVWSSPVSTGSGPGAVVSPKPEAAEPGKDDSPAWSNRYVYAFESDLLDNAFVHWDSDELTLEMISGYKQDSPAENEILYPARTIASGLGGLLADGTDGPITRIDKNWAESLDPAGAAQPFQPDVSVGASGPVKVREDGIEDPVAGWRPTGMVFFETMSMSPRGTVYSSSMLDSFNDHITPSPSTPQALESAPGVSGYVGEQLPFFDFPDTVAPAPPDATEEFPLGEVVVKGSGGGSGGVHLFRLVGKILLLLLAILGVGMITLAGSYAWYIKHRLYDVETRGTAITLIIKPGDSFRSIIDNMHRQGVLGSFLGLDDRYLMRYLAYAFENSDKVKPGVYRFSTGQNLQDVYDSLIAGSKDYKITIPEGVTAKEVGEVVAKQYLNFDAERFLQLVNDSQFIQALGVDAPSLEGYLYPSTYYFGPGMKEEELIKLMVGTFQGKVESVLKDKMTSATGLTFHEHVIMASLIEREARLDEDRPMIASVIYNRLEKNMPLQIDATVNYALNDWRRLTHADYTADHPYNTYKIKGLPPGPIASPRIESLMATFEAPDTGYLYYVHKGDGHHAFAETYAQHQANVGRYIREKNASGMGNAPSSDSQLSAEAAREEASADDTEPALATESDQTEDKSPSVAREGAIRKSDEVIHIKIEAPVTESEEESESDATQKESEPEEAESASEQVRPKSY